ncbi:MAG: antibiotic biosynthesis monooxygenase [Oscillatoriales cyanobacterium C42_A2020_001]|nr:antibiotic biosynthesis monooxygenase [Leptolyngbyaceae cyanobacterium C42_A2020_001]
MEDFHDCLTHKIAHVTVGEFQLGKFDEARRIYQEAVSTYGKGFEGAYLLQETGTERGIAVILWDSEQSMKENEGTEAHKTVLKKMMPLFATTPTTTYYEVVTEIQPGEAS